MKSVLRFFSVFNIFVGLLGVLFSIGLGVLAIGLGGGPSLENFQEVSLWLGPLGFAGILYSLSGVFLWKSLPSVRKNTLILTGSAWILCLVYCLRALILSNISFGAPYDEEVVMFVFIPTAMLLLIAIEVAFLWRTMMHQKGQQGVGGQPATPPRVGD